MDKLRERLSIDYFKREILKTTYGTRPSLIARLDPRTLFAWYLVFAIAPWLTYNRVVLVGVVAITALAALITRVSGLILFLLGFGMASQAVSLFVTVLIFGGDLTAFWAISTLVLKLLTVSLASVAAFAGLDPERLSDGLLAMGMPMQISFGVSYAFRIIPVLIDEYQSVFNALRLRTRSPERAGPFGLRRIAYWFRLVLRAFYPMMLNTAKRTRTTVEGLELRGFTYVLSHPDARALRVAGLSPGRADALWIGANGAILALVIALGQL